MSTPIAHLSLGQLRSTLVPRVRILFHKCAVPPNDSEAPLGEDPDDRQSDIMEAFTDKQLSEFTTTELANWHHTCVIWAISGPVSDCSVPFDLGERVRAVNGHFTCSSRVWNER